MKLYKRNANGKPIFWEIDSIDTEKISIRHGLVGKKGCAVTISASRDINKEMDSLITAKRKEGYKSVEDLYDNSPSEFGTNTDLLNYLNTYLPKDNTHADGRFIPMLCKTLKDNKPFLKHSYFGQWKINGERCIITATTQPDMFNPIKLHYRSRQGGDWTDKLSYLDAILLPEIPSTIMELMLDCNVGLDGELYIPGFHINEINSIIKNIDSPEHYNLQYWLYDLAIPDMSAGVRYELLRAEFSKHIITITSKLEHLNNKKRLILLPSIPIFDIDDAIKNRDNFIKLDFEGLVIRDYEANYQFGGKRNNAMLKFKNKDDGFFEVLAINTDKNGLPIFVLKNDINNEVFECTYNATHEEQLQILNQKGIIVGGLALVEFRERSGVKQVPFHAKIIRLCSVK